MLNLLETSAFRDPGNVSKALSLFPLSGRRGSTLREPLKDGQDHSRSFGQAQEAVHRRCLLEPGGRRDSRESGLSLPG